MKKKIFNIQNVKIEALEKKIGNTSLHYFPSLSHGKVKVYAKLEWEQFSKSVKARAGFNIIKTALHDGSLSGGKVLIDASSGNTGIAFAAVGQQIGLPVTICIPENVSKERIDALNFYGATVILTPSEEWMEGSQRIAREMVSGLPEKYFYSDQYNNDANWLAHYHSTGHEIWDQTDGLVTHFVAALGTTGTFMGTGRRLKKYNNDIVLVGLQPAISDHGMPGWKHMATAKVPSIYDPSLVEKQIGIDPKDTDDMIVRIAQDEGIYISPSAAGSLIGAEIVAKSINQGVVVTTLSDDIAKYGEVKAKLFPKL